LIIPFILWNGAMSGDASSVVGSGAFGSAAMDDRDDEYDHA
jgi:hypothetical protein